MTDAVEKIDPASDGKIAVTKEEMKKKYMKGGIIGGLIGIPAPVIGPIIGGLAGAYYMHRKYKKI